MHCICSGYTLCINSQILLHALCTNCPPLIQTFYAHSLYKFPNADLQYIYIHKWLKVKIVPRQ